MMEGKVGRECLVGMAGPQVHVGRRRMTRKINSRPLGVQIYSLMTRFRGSLESFNASPGLPRYGNPRLAGVA
jgi:hypothetical protein